MTFRWWWVRHPIYFINEVKRCWDCVDAIENNCDAMDALQEIYLKETGTQSADHDVNCNIHGPYVNCPRPCNCERKGLWGTK